MVADLNPLQRLSTKGVRCRRQRHGDNLRSRPKTDAAVKLPAPSAEQVPHHYGAAPECSEMIPYHFPAVGKRYGTAPYHYGAVPECSEVIPYHFPAVGKRYGTAPYPYGAVPERYKVIPYHFPTAGKRYGVS
jgi:hypothetical protein